MKAIIPSQERHSFYDRIIANDIETIADFVSEDKKNGLVIGMKYDDGIDTKYIFQMARIFSNCTPHKVTIFLETSYKLYRQLKKENSSLNLKKVNPFNKNKILYIIKPSYLKSDHKNHFSEERFYTPDLIQDIWYEYYEREEDFDELEDLL